MCLTMSCMESVFHLCLAVLVLQSVVLVSSVLSLLVWFCVERLGAGPFLDVCLAL